MNKANARVGQTVPLLVIEALPLVSVQLSSYMVVFIDGLNDCALFATMFGDVMTHLVITTSVAMLIAQAPEKLHGRIDLTAKVGSRPYVRIMRFPDLKGRSDNGEETSHC